MRFATPLKGTLVPRPLLVADDTTSRRNLYRLPGTPWQPTRHARALCLSALLLAVPLDQQPPPAAAVAGPDHIPLAVSDLDGAVAKYRTLGFAIKPGRHHANGIRNAHVKFPDGSGIELITADKAADDLTARYVDFLTHGDGPAFLALRAPDTGRLAAALRGGYALSHDGEVVNVLEPTLDYLFFVRGNRSPTDRPEHFAHPNGASALRSVWIATDAGATLERFLVGLGGTSARRWVRAPDLAEARVVSFDAGDVVILPAIHRLDASRPIIGASVKVASLDAAGRQLSRNGVVGRLETGPPRRLVLPPRDTCGLWMEFRESR